MCVCVYILAQAHTAGEYAAVDLKELPLKISVLIRCSSNAKSCATCASESDESNCCEPVNAASSKKNKIRYRRVGMVRGDAACHIVQQSLIAIVVHQRVCARA